MQTTYDENEVMKDIIIDDLEDLGDYLDIKQMAQNIKCYNEQQIKDLIDNQKLPSVIKNGVIKVKLEDYAKWYADIIDEIPKNGDDPDFYDGINIAS